jgi:glycosyltransferase involved in cell wall biosynthesis
MKIGIEVQRLFRKQKFGIETSALQLIKKLQLNFTNCEFIVYAKNDEDHRCLQSSDNVKISKLNGKFFFDFEHVFLPLAAKKDELDLLHCTGNTAPYFTSVPIVQTLHDVIFMDPISTSDTLYQQFGNYYRRRLVPLITPKSETVITVSNYEKRRILDRMKIDENKIKVIYNGIDEQRFRVKNDRESNDSIKTRYNLPEKYILFIGNTAARKNALRVIEAYALYASKTEQPVPIVAPGLNKAFIKEHLQRICQPNKLDSFITPGYIRDEDLAGLYEASTLFLYPSLSEGFGMPLVEAMACGTPVITSNISCLPEIAGNAAMLVDPTNVKAICEAITKLLSNEELRVSMVDLGIQNAKRFSWNKTALDVFEVYEKAIFNCKKQRSHVGNMAYGIQ